MCVEPDSSHYTYRLVGTGAHDFSFRRCLFLYAQNSRRDAAWVWQTLIRNSVPLHCIWERTHGYTSYSGTCFGFARLLHVI